MHNSIYYAIIIYIIIIILLIIIKPNCIYDHINCKYKKFGYTKDKSMFPIQILSILSAIIVVVLFSLINFDDDKQLSQQTPQQILQTPQQIPQQILQISQLPQILQIPQQNIKYVITGGAYNANIPKQNVEVVFAL